MDKLAKILSRVDFNAIWPKFRAFPFATENVDCADVELLAADAVRGMFYAFQKEQGESRYPDNSAFSRYPADLDNCNLKLAENFYLVKACMEASEVDLQQFAALRRARARIIGREMLALELAVETVEGMAEFAALSALNQINRGKFIDEIEKHMAALRNPENLLKPQKSAHSSGCILCFALKNLNIDFNHDLTDKRPLFDFVPRQVSIVEKALNSSILPQSII
jgi:hypothetical protein